MAVLHQLIGDRTEVTFDVSEEGVTSIGRHEDCDIVVESPAISRFHSQIVCEDGRYFVEDLNSRNGTFVNGLAVHRRTLLIDGDRVEFANLPFQFLSQDSLDEASGSWGIRANVVTISSGGDDEDSVRRHPIQPGDRISEDMLGSDSIRENRLIASVSVAESGAGWPVRENAIQKLNYCLRLMHTLRRITQTDAIIARTLQAFFDTFPAAQRIAVVMKDHHESSLTIRAAVAREEDEAVEICLPVVRRCLQNLEGLLYVDHWLGNEGEVPELASSAFRTILAVPMVGLVGECLGVIQLDTRNPDDALDESDLERLVVMSNIVAYALEQAQETKKAIAEAVMRRSTADADSLRRKMAAIRPPERPGYQIDSHLLAAPEIAGDIVDFVELPDGRIGCFLIDVPGRGPSAAGLMALVARLLSEAVLHTGSASTSLQMAQHELMDRLDSVPMVISAAVLILDPKRSAVKVSVAGHCPLYRLQRRSLEHMSERLPTGAGLGMARDPYSETEILLADDDTLLLFSDGITKLSKPSGKPIGGDSVFGILNDCLKDAAYAIDTSLKETLANYQESSTLHDDVVFALIRRLPNSDTASTIPVVVAPKRGGA